jgi:hypothetical protein
MHTGWPISSHAYLERRIAEPDFSGPTIHSQETYSLISKYTTAVGNFSLHHRVQTGSGAHPASYAMGTGGSFPGGKAAVS